MKKKLTACLFFLLFIAGQQFAHALHSADHHPLAIACFQCQGQGAVHRSKMPHGNPCIFCQSCQGCGGKGTIPSNANRCPKCNGEGRVHQSQQTHTPDCLFCQPCSTCDRKGWI